MQQWWWRAPYRPEEVGDGPAQSKALGTQAALIPGKWMRSPAQSWDSAAVVRSTCSAWAA